MEVKKNPDADIDRKKPSLNRLGYVLALAIVLSLFEYTTAEVSYAKQKKKKKDMMEMEEVMEMPNSTPPPPPPPPPPPVLLTNVEVTENEDEVNEDVQIINNEDNEVVEVVDIKVPEEKVVVDEIFEVVEEPAEFPGGLTEMYAFINKNFKYPEMAKQANVQGKVFVTFVVGKDGSIQDVTIRRGLGSGLDEEATRVVKMMPKWKPGKQRGVEVKTRFTLPIICKLQ